MRTAQFALEMCQRRNRRKSAFRFRPGIDRRRNLRTPGQRLTHSPYQSCLLGTRAQR